MPRRKRTSGRNVLGQWSSKKKKKPNENSSEDDSFEPSDEDTTVSAGSLVHEDDSSEHETDIGSSENSSIDSYSDVISEGDLFSENDYSSSLSSEDSDDSSTSSSTQATSIDSSQAMCANCKRSGGIDLEVADLVEDMYCLELKEYLVRKSSLRRKFSTLRNHVFPSVEQSGDTISLMLCELCGEYLSSCVAASCKEVKTLIWPVQIWMWLSSPKVIALYGTNAWKIVPRLWRPWWIDQFMGLSPSHRNVTLDQPPPKIRDGSSERAEFVKSLKDKLYKGLYCGIEEHMYLVVQCPWGCSEFYHKAVTSPFDVVMAASIGQTGWVSADSPSSFSKKVLAVTRSIRPDYICLDNNSVDSVYMNPKWRCMPTICFDDSVPCLMVCHGHGARAIWKHRPYVHVPKNIFETIPSAFPDQLSPAVLHPRTLRPIKAKHYSTSFQMQEMRGQYNGVDTMQLSRNHQFSVTSKTLEMHERNYVHGRHDIKQLVQEWSLGSEKEVPTFIAKNILKRAGEFNIERDDENALLQGSTMITCSDAMSLHMLMKRRKACSIFVPSKEESTETIEVPFNPTWPPLLIHIHPFGVHGAQFWPVAKTKRIGIDERLFWMVKGMLGCIPYLWKLANEHVQTWQSWEGFVLNHLCRTNLYGCSSKGSKYFALPSKGGALKKTLFLMSKMSLLEKEEMPTSSDEESDSGSSSSTISASVRNDGYYHPSLLCKLFRSYDNDLCVAEYDEALEPALALDTKVDESTNCCIIYRKYDYLNGSYTTKRPVDFPEEYALPGREGKWELRFLCSTSDGMPYSVDRRNRWSGEIFARHGGHFSGWWRINADSSYAEKEMTRGISSAIPSAKTWDVLVYVKMCDMKSDHVRDEFLSTLGGQSTMVCKSHKYPLVLCSSRRNPLKCSIKEAATDCQNKSCFRCPAGSCSASICAEHYRTFLEHSSVSGKVEIEPREHVAHREGNCMGDDASDSMSDDSRSSSDSSSSKPHELPTYGWDLEDLNNDDASSDHSESPEEEFPTTDTGNEKGLIDIEGIQPSASIPSHCLLNNCGNLLCRKETKLHGTNAQKGFLQGIVARTRNRSVPLLYPEAMLFPSIFWKSDNLDCTIPGAIPCGLMTSSGYLSKLNIASLEDHAKNRVMSTSLLTSSDDRYLCYSFDSIINLSCRNKDTRVILSRGCDPEISGIGIKGNSLKAIDAFKTDAVDSRPVVHKLAAAIGDHDAQYFATFSVNQLDHFGISGVKKWMDSNALKDVIRQKLGLCGELTPKEEHELKSCAARMGATIILRHWMEVAEIWMDYICNSPEQPLGKIWRCWWRHEYQDTTGNLSHIHALLWTKKGSESLDVTLDRIRGMTLDLIRRDEIDDLIEEGIISGLEEVPLIIEKAGRLLLHICSSRCLKRHGEKEGVLICRNADNFKESSDPYQHVTKEIQIEHTPEATQVLLQLGLFEVDPVSMSAIPIHQKLKATIHYPPSRKHEGLISACSGKLFGCTRSNQNLKHAPGYFSSRYLTNYLGLIDLHNRVYIGARAKEEYKYRMDMQLLGNTKVTGSAIAENKKHNQRRDKGHPCGRAISLMELISIILEYPQIYSTISFIHVPTVPLVERSGMILRPFLMRIAPSEAEKANIRTTRPTDLNSGSTIVGHDLRNVQLQQIPQWRRISPFEAIYVKDFMLSPFNVDAITRFGLRPPELRFVRNPKLFFRWFFYGQRFKSIAEANKVLDESLTKRGLLECPWIDMMLFSIHVRIPALTEIIEYIDTLKEESVYAADMTMPVRTENAKLQLLRFFKKLEVKGLQPPSLHMSQGQAWEVYSSRFFGDAAASSFHRDLPVIWTSFVPPTTPERWLVHILLSMGSYDNEYSLMRMGSILACFYAASLISSPTWSSVLETEMQGLLRQYVLRELVNIPGGTPTFDKYLVHASQALKAIQGNTISSANSYPPCLYTKLRYNLDCETRTFVNTSYETLMRCLWNDLHNKGMNNIPPERDFRESPLEESALDNVNISKGQHQPQASYEEQLGFTNSLKDMLFSYKNPSSGTATKGMIIVGGPGVGKTTMLQWGGMLSYLCGLRVALTAVMAERARQLGGMHIALLFLIPGVSIKDPYTLAQKAIRRLLNNRKHFELLRSLDVLLLDELGQVSADYLSTIDIIFRFVKDNDQSFGGVFIVATFDWLQLAPVDGKPPLLSPFALTSFRFISLKESVRASRDVALREIQEITRIPSTSLTPRDIRRFRTLVERKCTFVPTWDDARLTPNMMRLFGRKAATQREERRLLGIMHRRYANNFITRESIDLESSIEGMWGKASNTTVRGLNKKAKEPRQLAFFPGAQYEVTFNCENGKHSQGQVAVLMTMPRTAHVDAFLPVEVMLAPVGLKSIPFPMPDNASLVRNGWKKILVGCSPERSHVLVHGVHGKRKQYGLRHRIASTIHSGMGQDLSAVVTKVTCVEDDPTYALWDKGQLVVLMSRTNFAVDMIFVGDAKETSKALSLLLQKKYSYSEYSEHLLARLTCTTTHPQVTLVHHPFRAKDVEIPKTNAGYVYLLVSLRDKFSTYIGETSNLRRRLAQHNSGYGSSSTSDVQLRPWALMAFMTNFPLNESRERRRYELSWKNALQQQQSRNSLMDPDDACDQGILVIQNLGESRIVFVRCGTFRL